ncbi:hypothetical protein J6590_054487 [Homalodisca vitripennis]|nr:hypothetical protein J6590_054487 [Homalodisca vitripennis]
MWPATHYNNNKVNRRPRERPAGKGMWHAIAAGLLHNVLRRDCGSSKKIFNVFVAWDAQVDHISSNLLHDLVLSHLVGTLNPSGTAQCDGVAIGPIVGKETKQKERQDDKVASVAQEKVPAH